MALQPALPCHCLTAVVYSLVRHDSNYEPVLQFGYIERRRYWYSVVGWTASERGFECRQRHNSCTVSETQSLVSWIRRSLSLRQARSSIHEVLTFSADFGLFAISREVTECRSNIYIHIYTGSAKKCIHTLTKENSTLYNQLF